MIENNDARDAEGAIARANAEAAYLRGLLRRTDEDGTAFGIDAHDTRDAYLLVVNASRSADLHRIEAGVVSARMVHVPSALVNRVAGAVLADFNPRLAAKGAPAGSWPEPGGTVRLHACFGREIEMVMHAGAEGPQQGPAAIATWAKMDGRSRYAMWTKWKGLAVDDWGVWAMNEILKMLHVEALNQRDVGRMAKRQADAAAVTDDALIASLVRPRYADENDDDRAYRRQLWAEAKVYGDDRRARVAAMPEAA